MSKSQVKKELNALKEKEVVSIIMDLYDAYPEVKENLEARFAEDKAVVNAALLAKFKKIIRDEFYPLRGQEKCRVSVCKKAI